MVRESRFIQDFLKRRHGDDLQANLPDFGSEAVNDIIFGEAPTTFTYDVMGWTGLSDLHKKIISGELTPAEIEEITEETLLKLIQMKIPRNTCLKKTILIKARQEAKERGLI